jgi:CheY-like chemotaxis protein
MLSRGPVRIAVPGPRASACPAWRAADVAFAGEAPQVHNGRPIPAVLAIVATMSSKPSFAVAVVGLDASHRRLIEIVFRHIQHNRFVFTLAGTASLAEVDLLVADLDDASGRDALARAQSMRVPLPCIGVTGGGRDPDVRHSVEAGQLVRQLLPLLNRIVDDEGLVDAATSRREARASIDAVAADDATTQPVRVTDTAPPSLPVAVAARPRVLLIDDGGAVREGLADAVERLGLEVESASSGSEALARLSEVAVDLAMLDLRLPDGDGLELARAIRREPRLRALPIVVLGRRRSALDVVRSAAAGCSAFLALPVEIGDLHRTLSRQLGRALSRDAGPGESGLAGVASR